MSLKKVSGRVTFKKGGSVYADKHEITLLVEYPWKGGSISAAYKDAVNDSDQCPSAYEVHHVSDVNEEK